MNREPVVRAQAKKHGGQTEKTQTHLHSDFRINGTSQKKAISENFLAGRNFFSKCLGVLCSFLLAEIVYPDSCEASNCPPEISKICYFSQKVKCLLKRISKEE